MTAAAMGERDEQIREIAGQFPGWEPWQGLDGCWHARIVGAVPPVMVHAGSPAELCELISEKVQRAKPQVRER